MTRIERLESAIERAIDDRDRAHDGVVVEELLDALDRVAFTESALRRLRRCGHDVDAGLLDRVGDIAADLERAIRGTAYGAAELRRRDLAEDLRHAESVERRERDTADAPRSAEDLITAAEHMGELHRERAL